MEKRRSRNARNTPLLDLPRFSRNGRFLGLMVSDVVFLSLAETGGGIRPSFDRRVSRRPNEGGQAKRGSPVRGREDLEDRLVFHS